MSEDVDWRWIRHLLACRSGQRCEICGRALGAADVVSVHHRDPRGMGGTRVPWVHALGGLLLVCGDGVRGCHGAAESHRSEARRVGILVDGAAPEARPWHVPLVLASGRRVLLAENECFYLPAPPPAYDEPFRRGSAPISVRAV